MPTEKKHSAAAAAKAAESNQDTEHGPIIVDLGKKSRKAVRKLRKGKPGKLMDRIEEALAHLQENGALAADAQTVVVVVRQRSRGSKGVGKILGLG